MAHIPGRQPLNFDQDRLVITLSTRILNDVAKFKRGYKTQFLQLLIKAIQHPQDVQDTWQGITGWEEIDFMDVSPDITTILIGPREDLTGFYHINQARHFVSRVQELAKKILATGEHHDIIVEYFFPLNDDPQPSGEEQLIQRPPDPDHIMEATNLVQNTFPGF